MSDLDGLRQALIEAADEIRSHAAVASRAGQFRELLGLAQRLDDLWPLVVAAVDQARKETALRIEREIVMLPGTRSDGSAAALEVAASVARRAARGSVPVKEHE